MILSEWLISGGAFGANLHLDDETVALLKNQFRRLPLPDYPRWADAPPVRWFEGLGAILYEDAETWLWVRAPSADGIAAVQRVLPGEWLTDEGYDDAIPSERPAVLRKALTAAAGETGYLDYTEAAQAIAAAAIVAAHQPDGPALDPVYSPDCLRTDGPLDIPADLVSLSLRALDRVVAEDSHRRELLEEADRLDDVIAILAPVRTALERH